MSSLGTRIRKMRLRKGYEVDKLAYLTNLEPEIVEKIEKDEYEQLSISQILTLAKILGANLDYLLVGDTKSAEEEAGEDIEIDEHSFLKQVINDDIIEYMGHYPITFWANLFRKMCKKEISPDGMCRLIDAVDTVKPGEDNGNNGNGNNRGRQR